jgi:hypothetical protein
MDLQKFTQAAAKSVLDKGGAEQPEWLRIAIAERLKAREAAAGDAEAAPGGDAAPPETSVG